MANYLGDFSLGKTLDFKFCTVQATGAPTTLAGTPVISAYVDNSTTQITAGITLTVDFDSVTGLNNVRVVATIANGYAFGSNYDLVVTTGTVNSISAVGYCVGSFSLGARAAGSMVRSAIAQAGAAQSITLDASASSTTDFYGGATTSGCLCVIVGGTGVGQARYGTAYNGTTKVLSVDRAWVTNPDSTSVFELYASSAGFSVAEIQTGLATPTNITAGTITTATNVTTVNGIAADAITAAAIAANAIGASELATDAVSEIVTAVLTTAMTESYAADGAAPTLAQALFLNQQMLTEKAISSTTVTVKKLDGSTTAATLTLDSATTPTSITRTT